ncbi:MAG: hypothetical protein S4CHLAM6_16220 [Chlamydiae bacterium]|nr:hypothetical protein [Chlamydiota bacterium]
MKKNILLTAAIAFCALFSSQSLRAEENQPTDTEKYSMSLELKKVVEGQVSEFISSSEILFDEGAPAKLEINSHDESGNAKKFQVEALVETNTQEN